MTEIVVNGSTYDVGNMSDDELAVWLRDRLTTDAVMQRLTRNIRQTRLPRSAQNKSGQKLRA